MQKNVGEKDAHIRTFAAVVLIVLALLVTTNPYMRIVLALAAGAFALSAYMRTCFFYTLLGKNSCHTDEEVSSKPTVTSQKGVAPEHEETVSEKSL